MDMFNKAVHAVCLVMAMSVASAMGEKLELDECKDRASAGDADAAWQLGQRYESGDGVRKDNLRAVAQYRKAAAKNGCSGKCGTVSGGMRSVQLRKVA